MEMISPVNNHIEESIPKICSNHSCEKLVYTNSQILQLKLNDYCFVKPLHIVRIWRRKLYTQENNGLEPKQATRIFREPCIQKSTQRPKLGASSDTPAITPIIMSTLNKLSPLNIAKLRNQLYEISIRNEENLKILVEKIFIKACFEKKYTGMWANLCNYISALYKSGKKNDENQEAATGNSFKGALLSLSQTLFENFEQGNVDSGYLVKKKLMGNINFIGELYKMKLIPPKTIHRCLQSLLESNEDNTYNEDKVEGAAVLIKSAGEKIERLGDAFNIIMDQITTLMNSDKISPRIRFLLMVKYIQDIIELKNNNWNSC
jgi:translation initiation factor 4G